MFSWYSVFFIFFSCYCYYLITLFVFLLWPVFCFFFSFLMLVKSSFSPSFLVLILSAKPSALKSDFLLWIGLALVQLLPDHSWEEHIPNKRSECCGFCHQGWEDQKERLQSNLLAVLLCSFRLNLRRLCPSGPSLGRTL